MWLPCRIFLHSIPFPQQLIDLPDDLISIRVVRSEEIVAATGDSGRGLVEICNDQLDPTYGASNASRDEFNINK